MNGLLATLYRELRAYFYSPLAYVVLTLWLLFNGAIFAVILTYLNGPQAAGSVTPLKLYLGGTFLFWVVMLIMVPVLTMRLLAEERRSGTIEALMTAPISEIQVVVGKYLAALAFYLFLWLPTLAYAAIVARSSAELDWGPVASGYLGVVGIGAVFLAVGIFGSALTRNQIVAALVTFAMLLGYFILVFVDYLLTEGTAKEVLGYVNLADHMDELGNGLVDTRRLIFWVTMTVLFLFLSGRALQARKWR